MVLARHDRAGVVRNLEQWSTRKIHAVSKMGDAASVVTRKRVAVRICERGEPASFDCCDARGSALRTMEALRADQALSMHDKAISS